jgi:hypothetical protein
MRISSSIPGGSDVFLRRCETEILRFAIAREVVVVAIVVGVEIAVVVVELVVFVERVVVVVGRIVVVVVVVVVVGPRPTGVAFPVGRGLWIARFFTCEIAVRSSGT